MSRDIFLERLKVEPNYLYLDYYISDVYAKHVLLICLSIDIILSTK